MQLGKLRAAIRKESTVKVIVEGLGIEVAVQKTDLLKALGNRFDGQTVETGMELVDGCLIEVGWIKPRAEPKQLDLVDAINQRVADDDDLLGDLF